MAVTLDRYIARRDGSLDYLNAFFFLMAQRDYLSSLTSRKNLFINPFSKDDARCLKASGSP